MSQLGGQFFDSGRSESHFDIAGAAVEHDPLDQQPDDPLALPRKHRRPQVIELVERSANVVLGNDAPLEPGELVAEPSFSRIELSQRVLAIGVRCSASRKVCST